MEKFIKYFPEILNEASKSIFGLISLSILCLTVITSLFINKDDKSFMRILFGVFSVSLIGFFVTTIYIYRLIDFQNLEQRSIELEKAVNSKKLQGGITIPEEVLVAQRNFEVAWYSTSKKGKYLIDDSLIYLGLNSNVNIYEVMEFDSKTKLNTLKWCDEAISLFENKENNEILSKLLLVKSSSLFDISQLNHTNPVDFQKYSLEGEKLIARAYNLSTKKNKTKILRQWSRFYYNLARPHDNVLSRPWNNNLLSLAVEKSQKALETDSSLKSSTQYCRSIQKLYSMKPYSDDSTLTPLLVAAWTKHLRIYNSSKDTIEDILTHLSALNIASVLGLDICTRIYFGKSNSLNSKMKILEMLDSKIIPYQDQLILKLESSELKETYSFDVNYDMARMYAMKYVVTSTTRLDEASEVYELLKKSIIKSKQSIKNTTQAEALCEEVKSKAFFTLLPRKIITEFKTICCNN